MSIRPEQVLLLGAAGIGVLALLFPLLLRHNNPAMPLSWPRLGAGAGVIVLLFALTRLRTYPFAPGETLGDGLAIGGIIALATAALAAFWPGTAATVVGASGGAVLGAALMLLRHRGYPDAALAGFGAGHAIATLLAASGEEGEERAQWGGSGLWAGPVVAALLAGATLLAIHRFEDLRSAERLALEGKVWWVWPVALAATVLAGQMVGLSLFARRSWAPGTHVSGCGAGLVAALLLLLLWLRFPRYAPLLTPLAAGFVTALLLLMGGRRSGESSEWSEPAAVLPALLAPALALLLLATAYRLYAGYGIALAALGAAVLLPWLAEQEPRAAGRALFGLLAAAVLFRVYYQSYDLGNNDIPLTAHYAMVSLLAGALAPWALGIVQEAASRRQGARDSWYLAPVTLLSAAALPLLLALFWGEKSGGGLLLGLVIGQGYRMMAALLEADPPGPMAVVAARVPEAALLLMGWVTVQLLDLAATLGLQLLRVQRVGLIAVLFILCVLALWYGAWSRPRRLTAARALD